MLVAICVATYRRPESLRRLIVSLSRQSVVGFTSRTIVVDNDAEGSAQRVIDDVAELIPDLIYAIESERGIPAARNRLVELALEVGAEYVVFVDDDEWVEPQWLQSLVTTAIRLEADAVAGPVLPSYEEGVPRWIAQGAFFQRPRYQTGQRLRVYGTGNLLLKGSALGALTPPFDRRFDLTGGSDTYLMERLARVGTRLVWCDEAVVYETIPLSRASSRWILRRAFRVGLNHSRCVVALDGQSRLKWTVRLAKSAGWFGRGVLMLPFCPFRGRKGFIAALAYCARGAGGILGLYGFVYEEYHNVHGR